MCVFVCLLVSLSHGAIGWFMIVASPGHTRSCFINHVHGSLGTS